MILSDVHAQPVVAIERSGLYDELGEDNVTGNLDDALNRAREHLGLPRVERPTFATPTVAQEAKADAALNDPSPNSDPPFTKPAVTSRVLRRGSCALRVSSSTCRRSVSTGR